MLCTPGLSSQNVPSGLWGAKGETFGLPRKNWVPTDAAGAGGQRPGCGLTPIAPVTPGGPCVSGVGRRQAMGGWDARMLVLSVEEAVCINKR